MQMLVRCLQMGICRAPFVCTGDAETKAGVYAGIAAEVGKGPGYGW